MTESERKSRQTKERIGMSRLIRRDQQDRAFDIEFWQKVGAQGRFAAAWQMVKDV